MSTYKISASLLNKYLYYKLNPSLNILEQLKDYLKKVYTDNKYTTRGNEYEKEVESGKAGSVSKLLKGLPTQKWFNGSIDVNGSTFKINGKLDYIDIRKGIIYDLKRTDMFSLSKYEEDYTCQHLLYFYICPEAHTFYYVVAYGEEEVEGVKVVKKVRPEQEDLEEKIKSLIREFISFLTRKNLIELYINNYKERE